MQVGTGPACSPNSTTRRCRAPAAAQGGRRRSLRINLKLGQAREKSLSRKAAGQKQHPAHLQYLQNSGFEGEKGYRVSGNDWPRSPAIIPTTPTTSSKNATTAYPQNFQNLGSPSVPVPTPAFPGSPDGAGPALAIVELPAAGGRYRKLFAFLLQKPPAYIPVERWQQAVEDGRSFLHKWANSRIADWVGATYQSRSHRRPSSVHSPDTTTPDCAGCCVKVIALRFSDNQNPVPVDHDLSPLQQTSIGSVGRSSGFRRNRRDHGSTPSKRHSAGGSIR